MAPRDSTIVVTVVLVGPAPPWAGDDGAPDATTCAGEGDAVAVGESPSCSAVAFCPRDRLIKCCRKRSWDAAWAGIVSVVAGIPADSAAALIVPQPPKRLRLRIIRHRSLVCFSRLLVSIRCMPCSSSVPRTVHHPYLELLYPFHGTDDIRDADTKFVINDDHFPSRNELLIH